MTFSDIIDLVIEAIKLCFGDCQYRANWAFLSLEGSLVGAESEVPQTVVRIISAGDLGVPYMLSIYTPLELSTLEFKAKVLKYPQN